MKTLDAPGKSVTCRTIINRNPLNYHHRQRVKSNKRNLKVRIKMQNN